MSPPCPGVLTGIFSSGTSGGHPVPEEGVLVPAPWQEAAPAASAVCSQRAAVCGLPAAGAPGQNPAAAGGHSQHLHVCHCWWQRPGAG